ncbi:MAG TPA: VOC family protein [Caulobacterales bacterium]|nr:VOC family protein [Caulobacterales bacterium]
MPRTSPCLWFDKEAEEAANFYVPVFPNSTINTITRYGANMHGPEGSVLTVSVSLDGQDYLLLNGGPMFTFSEAISFLIYCKSQAEIDAYWDRLTAEGGKASIGGWLKDKYGLSWQVVVEGWDQMLADPDKSKSERVMAAVMKMKKIDLETIRRAYAGS